MQVDRPGEDEIIAKYFAPLAGAAGLGLADDAAAFALPPGTDVVVTKDMLCAGVHFFADDPPDAIARKALRVNLSDLAAKGAKPLGFLLGLALPGNWTPDWLAAFAKGLGEDAAAYDCPLIGGDTVKSPGPLMLSITAIGGVPAGLRLVRGNIADGDLLYVSGTVGDAALGLKLRREPVPDWAQTLSVEARKFLGERYLLPQPRLGLGAALRVSAHAAMDVSDGFAGDLAKMLRASGMTATIAVEDMPLSVAARTALGRDGTLIETILGGGDDYEILAAVSEREAVAFENNAALAGIRVQRIGTARAGKSPAVFQNRAGRVLALQTASFSHF